MGREGEEKEVPVEGIKAGRDEVDEGKGMTEKI